jgi:hypothetical protein
LKWKKILQPLKNLGKLINNLSQNHLSTFVVIKWSLEVKIRAQVKGDENICWHVLANSLLSKNLFSSVVKPYWQNYVTKFTQTGRKKRLFTFWKWVLVISAKVIFLYFIVFPEFFSWFFSPHPIIRTLIGHFFSLLFVPRFS